MNNSYAPYLPPDEKGSKTFGNYIRLLTENYSLEPLIRAVEMSEKNSMTYEELPNGIFRQISVSCLKLSQYLIFVIVKGSCSITGWHRK